MNRVIGSNYMETACKGLHFYLHKYQCMLTYIEHMHTDSCHNGAGDQVERIQKTINIACLFVFNQA